MRFSTAAFAAFVALTVAAPTPKSALQVRQSGPVLTATTFNDITISGGKAGNGEAEALAVFSKLDLNNPGNIDEADIEFLDNVNGVANDAEKEAFNPAIEAASGAAKDALAAGKTKNKILKLMATKIQLEAKAARGEDVAAKQADENKKLQTNIDADVARAGKPSTAVNFAATISGGN